MEIAPGWHLFTRGPAENVWKFDDLAMWEAGLIAPDGTEHVIRTDSEESLRRHLSELLASLGVRANLSQVTRDDPLPRVTLDPL